MSTFPNVDPKQGSGLSAVRQVRLHVVTALGNGSLSQRNLGQAIDSLAEGDIPMGCAYLGFSKPSATSLQEDDAIGLAEWLQEHFTGNDGGPTTAAVTDTGDAKPGLGKRSLSALAFLFAAYALGNSYVPEAWKVNAVQSVSQGVTLLKSGYELASSNPDFLAKIAGGGVLGAVVYGWLRSFLNPIVLGALTVCFRTGVCLPTAVFCYAMSLLLGGVSLGATAAKTRSDGLLAKSRNQARQLVPQNVGMKLASFRRPRLKEVTA